MTTDLLAELSGSPGRLTVLSFKEEGREGSETWAYREQGICEKLRIGRKAGRQSLPLGKEEIKHSQKAIPCTKSLIQKDSGIKTEALGLPPPHMQ